MGCGFVDCACSNNEVLNLEYFYSTNGLKVFVDLLS